MASHSSTLAWKIPWAEEPGRLQSIGSLKVGHDWVTSLWLHFDLSLSCVGEGNGNLLQCSCLENPRDGGAWWAAFYGVAQSRTWLKRLSSCSPIYHMLSTTDWINCSCTHFIKHRNFDKRWIDSVVRPNCIFLTDWRIKSMMWNHWKSEKKLKLLKYNLGFLWFIYKRCFSCVWCNSKLCL